MNAEERQIRLRLRDDFKHYSSRCLFIRTGSDIKPFTLNRAQTFLDDSINHQKSLLGRVRIIILKGRQQGASTYVEGRYYWLVTHRYGVRAFILTHDSGATVNLFEMAKRYHENCPELVRPSIKSSNAKELVFGELDSGYRLGTAGNKSVGRSSTIQYLHGSEVAFWPNAAEHAKGILQAVPGENDTEIILESTANGMGNYFHQQWQKAEAGLSDFMAIFLPWYWQDEYQRKVPGNFIATAEEEVLKKLYGLTDNQLEWRRYKIIELSVTGADGEKSFKQEYPLNSVEAFQTSGEDVYISPDLVMAARKQKCEGVGALIIGVDPARKGDDRTCIVRRKGRKIYNLESYTKKDAMQVTGILHNILENEKPDKMFVDMGSFGAAIYDRLIELGHGDIVVGVNFGGRPLDQARYVNKRAEMWGTLKKALQDTPCELPDDDALHADLCSTKYDEDSEGRLILESKSKMKARGIRSPDAADAVVLTYAFPVSAFNKKDSGIVAKSIMAKSNRIQQLRKSRAC